MAVNRLVDRSIDATNPRTQNRELPTGKVSVRFVRTFSILMLVLFVLATLALPSLAAFLCPLAILFLVGYAYTKRFTWWCHFFLGITLGMAPLGGWIASTGTLSWTAYGLALLVMLWVAGFDILYACTDAEFDRSACLHALPARFGIPNAVVTAGVLHVGVFLGWLVLSWWSGFLRPIFLSGMVIILFLMGWMYRWIRRGPLTAWPTVIFPCNGGVSIVLFLSISLDIILGTSLWGPMSLPHGVGQQSY